MEKGNSILIEQKTLISIPQWDEIVRDLIMFSDNVWLHYDALRFDNSLDSAIERQFIITLNDLVDSGLICFYALESDSDEAKKKSSRIITKEEHMQLYDSIINKVQNPNSFTADSLEDPERTSRIIEKRNELWKYGLATLLDADISCTCQDITKNNVLDEISNRSLNSSLTNQLFSAFEISSLAHLNAQDIVDFRKKAKRYRKVIENLVAKARTNKSGSIESAVDEEFNNYISRVNELASDAAGNGAIKKLIMNSSLNIMGLIPFSFLVLVPITAILCGKDLFEFITSRKKYGFVLFMNSLKSKSIES